jgi:hypothetical protein
MGIRNNAAFAGSGVLAIAGLIACAEASEVPGPATIVLEQRVAIDPVLANKKERENLSGAACSPAGPCLLIGDEKAYARFFTLSGTQLVPGEPLYLLPKAMPSGDETDGEGVAFANDYFYVIGSHSQNKQGEKQPSRDFLYRIRIDPKTGMPADLGTADKPSASVDITTLRTVIDKTPPMTAHLEEAPGEGRHGVNIEGIAVSGDDIFIGFRGPVTMAGVPILRLSEAGLFGCKVKLDKPSTCDIAVDEPTLLNLGPRQGIRDLAAVDGGLLILSGPEMRGDTRKPQLFFWDGTTIPPVPLGALPPGPDGPESITVLQETADSYRLLVLSDGDAGGDPMIVRVRKPGH